MAGTRQRRSAHGDGEILRDLIVTLVQGFPKAASTLSDLAAFRDQPEQATTRRHKSANWLTLWTNWLPTGWPGADNDSMMSSKTSLRAATRARS